VKRKRIDGLGKEGKLTKKIFRKRSKDGGIKK
jgi:hypothetical protein